jgi:hypothetical protein
MSSPETGLYISEGLESLNFNQKWKQGDIFLWHFYFAFQISLMRGMPPSPGPDTCKLHSLSAVDNVLQLSLHLLNFSLFFSAFWKSGTKHILVSILLL